MESVKALQSLRSPNFEKQDMTDMIDTIDIALAMAVMAIKLVLGRGRGAGRGRGMAASETMEAWKSGTVCVSWMPSCVRFCGMGSWNVLHVATGIFPVIGRVTVI